VIVTRERGARMFVRMGGGRGGVVLRRMVMRETVDRLGKEEAKTQYEGEQKARNAWAAQVPHAGKITGSRRYGVLRRDERRGRPGRREAAAEVGAARLRRLQRGGRP